VYVGGGESEAPIHDIELMLDHYAKDLAFEFLEKLLAEGPQPRAQHVPPYARRC
jgi:hypothetical protein